VVLVAGAITSIHADVCAPVAVSVTVMLNVPSGTFAPAFMNVEEPVTSAHTDSGYCATAPGRLTVI
jgi:hypothetical protein